MSERIARLRIELQELEPKIWRRIDMPLSATLEALHEAIQMTMGWTFSHLREFDIDGRCYGDPSFREFDDEPVICQAKGLRLGAAIARSADRFVYTYDYGDNWRHDVIVEEVRDGDPDMEYPILVDGARRCSPEDVGGVDGFMDFLEGSPIRGTRTTRRWDALLVSDGGADRFMDFMLPVAHRSYGLRKHCISRRASCLSRRVARWRRGSFRGRRRPCRAARRAPW